MAQRRETFKNSKIYHIYNRSIDNLEPFKDHVNSIRFIKGISYYQYMNHDAPLSQYLRKAKDQDPYIHNYLKTMHIKDKQVEILSYCLLPNHYHLLIKQIRDGGIESFISNVVNSFSRYYNLMKKRRGPIFFQPFNSKRILTDSHLLTTWRYVNINPYRHSFIKRIKRIAIYPWSSCRFFLAKKPHNLTEDNSLEIDLIAQNFIQTYDIRDAANRLSVQPEFFLFSYRPPHKPIQRRRLI